MDKTSNTKPDNRLGRDWYFTLYMLLLALIALAAVIRPKCNYDGVFYTALTSRNASPDVFHRYGMEYEAHEPENSPSPYRQDLDSNPAHFAEQLPFYSVKPLYVIVLGLARKIGFDWRSGALISGLCFCLLGWVIWLWLRNYFTNFQTAVLSSILMLNPTLLQVLRWTSPDVMVTLCAVGGSYLILEGHLPVTGIGLLLVGIWVRPELVIFTGLAICAVCFYRKISFLEAGTLSVLALASYFAISKLGALPYSVLFYNTFVARQSAPLEATSLVTKRMYLSALIHSLQTTLFADPLLYVPLLVCAVTYFVFRRRDLYSAFSVVALLASIILYLAHPRMEARYYLYQLAFMPAVVLLVQLKRTLDGAHLRSEPLQS